MSALARLLARITAPLAFATRARTARHLFGFALAEHESMLELRAAAALAASAERSALYLRHALDEERHATAFARHAQEICRAIDLPAFGHPRTGTASLFERLGEVRFLAFVHLGEERGRSQFQAYQAFFAARGDDKLRALFAALIGDEREHERYTRELLGEQVGEDSARRVLRRVAALEALRRFHRAGRSLTTSLYRLAMTLLYLMLWPLALVVRVARPKRIGWRA